MKLTPGSKDLEDLKARTADMSPQNRLAEIISFAEDKGVKVQMAAEGFQLNFSPAEAASRVRMPGEYKGGWVSM